MGKYMRKSKTTGEVALIEVSHTQSFLGVRTRAKTLAMQRLQKSSSATVAIPATANSGGSYLQLRNRRLEKSPIHVAHSDLKRQKHSSKESLLPSPSPRKNSDSRARSRLRSLNSGSGESVSLHCLNKEKVCLDTEEMMDPEEEIPENDKDASGDVGIEASFGENVLEFEGRERSTRETTPCSLIRDPDTIKIPGSSTRPASLSETNSGLQNSMRRHIPTAHEMDEFFSGAEEQQRRQFTKKYNFDPLKDKPLRGRYEWVKVDP